MTVHSIPVSFTSEGETLAGDLIRPADAPADAALPALVVTGSWLTVRKQMATRYARRMAERGFLALVFDYRGYGESGGQPRDFESPARKIEDTRAAISYLAAHPLADPDRIGTLGVCAGAGYNALAAASEPRVRSMAMIAPWLHDAELVETVYGGAQGVAERARAGREALDRWRETGEMLYVPAVSATDPAAAMYGAFDYYLDRDRGAIPEWSNRFAVMAWPGWFAFDPIAAAAGIDTPTLLVHSEQGAIPEGARRFHDALAGPKKLLWTEGTQFDFYDREPQVGFAVDAAAEHFAETIGVVAG